MSPLGGFWRYQEISSIDYMSKSIDKMIVADIFGVTPALIALGRTINADIIVDPYGGKVMNFDNEAQAYHYFINNVGLDAYVNKLSKIMKECADRAIIIGFSVGAAAIWKLSASTDIEIIKRVKCAICFYGSQIRHLTTLSPNFDIQLIFPKNEAHFDAQALVERLANKKRVTAVQVDFLHGFMNYHSSNFNQAGYTVYIKLLQQILI